MRLRHTCCAYAASYLACWPTLQRVCPALRDVDFATSKLRSIAAARDAYEPSKERTTVEPRRWCSR